MLEALLHVTLEIPRPRRQPHLELACFGCLRVLLGCFFSLLAQQLQFSNILRVLRQDLLKLQHPAAVVLVDTESVFCLVDSALKACEYHAILRRAVLAIHAVAGATVDQCRPIDLTPAHRCCLPTCPAAAAAARAAAAAAIIASGRCHVLAKVQLLACCKALAAAAVLAGRLAASPAAAECATAQHKQAALDPVNYPVGYVTLFGCEHPPQGSDRGLL
jgi:hypothetical protein